jgi:hypothetical protein
MSLCVRFIHIDNPIIERHGFRQTQTAITVQTWINEGINIFKYQTPVLGEPWTLPFEFPLFQLCAYGIYIIMSAFGNSNLDIAMRITNILFFYGCVPFIYLISLRLYRETKIAKSICIVFVLLPYSIFWSRTSMIEFAAVFFGLGYVYFFWEFLKKETWRTIIAAALFGILGYLAKSTSMLPDCLFLAFVILHHLFAKNYFSKTELLSKRTIYICLKMLIMVAVPLIIGVIWTKWSDYVKDTSGFAALDSASLRRWNFGTLPQKLNFKKWMEIVSAIRGIIGRISSIVVFLSFLLFVIRNKKENLAAALLPAVCAFITVCTFFNLYYVHDYYFCAVLPFMCMSAVCIVFLGMKYMARTMKIKKIEMFYGILIAVLAVSVYFKNPYIPYITDAYTFSCFELTNYIQNNTRQTDKIMVFDNDWSSEIPYYSKRKALMVVPWLHGERYADVASQYELFVMKRDSDENEQRKNLLQNIVSETAIDTAQGNFDVYRNTLVLRQKK